MGKIVLLDDLTINKIAAGEVIERPASVIKELVENSIDAGATNITVEIKNGGISYIRVTDNGKGIEPDDMEIAFERHATSKIRVADDLQTVTSMGFRGEALASIAAISKVTMQSKTEDQETGYKIIVEGGNVKEKEEIGCQKGTVIEIEDLFYNTPVRYKFLKKDFTEAGYIEDVITRIGLIHPEISIRLINTGKTVIQTSGNNNMKDVIYSIYGKDIAENIIEVNYEYEDIIVSGVIGKPEIARSNRSNQIFFVNKRYVKDKTLTSSVDQAYKDKIPYGKFGFLVLNIEMNPAQVDVNVHPAKLEVRFEEEQKVFKAVYHAIKDKIAENEPVTYKNNLEKQNEKIEGFETQDKIEETRQNFEKSLEEKNIEDTRVENKGLFSKLFTKKENDEEDNEYKPSIIEEIYESRKNDINEQESEAKDEKKITSLFEKMNQMKNSSDEFSTLDIEDTTTDTDNLENNEIEEQEKEETIENIQEQNQEDVKNITIENIEGDSKLASIMAKMNQMRSSVYEYKGLNPEDAIVDINIAKNDDISENNEVEEIQEQNQEIVTENIQEKEQNQNQNQENEIITEEKNDFEQEQENEKNEEDSENYLSEGALSEGENLDNQVSEDTVTVEKVQNEEINTEVPQETIVITEEMKNEIVQNMNNEETQIIDREEILKREKKDYDLKIEKKEDALFDKLYNNDNTLTEEELVESEKDEVKQDLTYEIEDIPKEKFEEMYSSVFGTAIKEEVKETQEKYIMLEPDIEPCENVSLFSEDGEEKKIPDYKYIGQAFSKYIIIEINNEILIIDERAANEKIIYEYLKKKYYNPDEKDSQLMLLPDIIELTSKEMDIAKENMDIFEKAGFILEEFGENTIKLSGVPEICLELDTKELFTQVLNEMNKVAMTKKDEIEAKFIETLAKNIAVSMEIATEKSDIDILMQKLLALDNPFVCVDYRPVAIKMTRADIEKKFSRR